MKTKRFTLIVLSFVLSASMAGCGIVQAQPTSIPVPTNTPIPTSTPIPMPPKLGHYTGKNPEVSFDLTASGIEKFTITIPLNGSGTCLAEPSGILDINSKDGSFSNQEAKTDSVNISGIINGGNVNGDYSVNSCITMGSDGSLSMTFFQNPLQGKWSANLNGQ